MIPLGRDVITALVLGPSEEGVLVSDSPVRGDVWAAYAAAPDQPVNVLIEALRASPTGQVAAKIADRLYHSKDTDAQLDYGISFVEGYISAKVTLERLAFVLLPMTDWFQDFLWEGTSTLVEGKQLTKYLRWQFERLAGVSETNRTEPPFDYHTAQLSSIFRVLVALFWAKDLEDEGGDNPQMINSIADLVKRAGASTLAQRARTLFEKIVEEANGYRIVNNKAGERNGVIFAISRNRPIELALDRSVPAVKADAVRSLFKVSCERIGWAVLDTGIDSEHKVFEDEQGQSRIKASYDFTRLSRVVQIDHLYNEGLLNLHAGECVQFFDGSIDEENVKLELTELAKNAQKQRPIDWTIAEKYLTLHKPKRPMLPHGTHVAGILGARGGLNAEGRQMDGGMCPNIGLFDFRVVTQSADDTEFSLIGALQFIRWLNERNHSPQIHGANISLSIPHDVRNYACGRTPVCSEAERLVNSGVVVVVAAGNRGYQSLNLAGGGSFDTYTSASITDPGNAEAVITVGSTHRFAPHNYGVSFFSSRGPTGDGRAKPDLVAPGEKIWSAVPVNAHSKMSGTSMAAPHVSGAAALLMARNSEFIGQAARIKQILCKSCTDLGRERDYQGAGMLDILRAMQSI